MDPFWVDVGLQHGPKLRHDSREICLLGAFKYYTANTIRQVLWPPDRFWTDFGPILERSWTNFFVDFGTFFGRLKAEQSRARRSKAEQSTQSKQSNATCSNMFQRVPTCSSMLQHVQSKAKQSRASNMYQHVAAFSNMFQAGPQAKQSKPRQSKADQSKASNPTS